MKTTAIPMTLLRALKQITTGNNLSNIAKSAGVDEKRIQSALSMGLPLFMGSMANSVSKSGGAETLTNMLTQAGASNPLDNLGSFLGNPERSLTEASVSKQIS